MNPGRVLLIALSPILACGFGVSCKPEGSGDAAPPPQVENETITAPAEEAIPADVPVADGTILAQLKRGNAFILNLTSTLSPVDAVTFYRTQLADQGWSEKVVMRMPHGSTLQYEKDAGARTLHVVVSPHEPGGASVNITVETRNSTP